MMKLKELSAADPSKSAEATLQCTNLSVYFPSLAMELLQEYFFIPLDIFRKSMENKTIDTELEAWLAFLSFTDPNRIEELITRFPRFQAMYQDIYDLCLNTEKVMGMYSKELQMMDRNTVLYMIDELQGQVNEAKQELDQISQELVEKREELAQKREELEKQDQELEQKDQKLAQKEEELTSKDQQIAALKAQLAALLKQEAT